MNKKHQSHEKAKDFKKSILRLFKELNSYKIIIIIAFIFAILGSIISISAPNRLTKLTDEISDGLVINSKNMKAISNSIDQDVMNKNISQIMAFNINPNTINNIQKNNNISIEDKNKFNNFLQQMKNMDKNTIMNSIVMLPDSILNEIISDSTYKNVLIKKDDKISLLKNISNKKLVIPNNIKKVLFDEITVSDVKLSSYDQASFIEIMSTVKKDSKPEKIYSKIDKMPKNIKNLVKPKMNMKKIKNIVIILVIIYILSSLFTYFEHFIMTVVANKFAKRLRNDISVKINKLPLKYFDNHISGDILSRITNDVDTIAQSMNQALATFVSAITLLVGSIIMMFVTNYIMAFTAILSSLFGFAFMFIVLGKSQKYFVERQVELGKLNGHIEEIYSGINVVRSYNGEEESLEKFEKYNTKVCYANKKSQFLSGLMPSMMTFIGNFGYVAVCIVGALLTMKDQISFGVIIAFISYVRLFTSPLSQIAQAMTSMQSTAAASERVFEFLDEEEMNLEDDKKKVLKKSTVKGEIEFNNVSFTYDGNKKPTINNFNAKVKPGQKIAIVGPTGAGKTTMVNLLMKFYEISSGDIKIDGVSIHDLKRENIHKLFTMVLQDTWLFEGTIKENIVYNRKNVSQKRVEEVCEKVGLNHFIKTLSHGYDTYIKSNDSVSAGQRQLMTIARGMIEEAPFLILDEATSNVDTRTEELVQIAMDKLTHGKTSFIIAHRLSTIKNADLILVMKNGDIIESGNHDKLMKDKGFYYDLYSSQFKL